MDQQFCFMCGASTVASVHHVVPVCAECRSRGITVDQEQGRWVVQRQGDRPRGPLTRDGVLNWLARGRLGPDDQVCRVGGAWHPVADHVDFRGCFIPGSEDQKWIAHVEADNRRTIARARRNKMVRTSGAAMAMIGGVGFLGLGLFTRALVLPPVWLDRIVAVTSSVQTVLGGENGAAGETLDVSLLPDLALTGEGVEPQIPAPLAFQQGWSGLWRGSRADTRAAWRSFADGLRQSPLDVDGHAGLVEAGAVLQNVDNTVGSVTMRARARLEMLAPKSIPAIRARAALALADGNVYLAAELTRPDETNDKSDLGCRLIHSEATRDTALLDALAKEYPNSGRVQRARARGAMAVGDWVTVEDAGNALVRLHPDDGAGYAFIAEAAAATARWSLAARQARRALDGDPWRIPLQHLLGAIDLRIKGAPQRAIGTYRQLVEDTRLSTYADKQTVLVQAADAALKLGELDVASAWLDTALAEQPDDNSALLVRAAIQLRRGDAASAETFLRQMDEASEEGLVGARNHLWAGRLFLEMGIQRLARNELEAAIRLAPTWLEPHMELASARLATGNVAAASADIRALVWLDRSLQHERDPRTDSGLGPPPIPHLSEQFQVAIRNDIRMAEDRDATLGILSWLEDRPGTYALLRAAVARDEGRVEVHAALARAYLSDGLWSEAAVHAERVLAARPREGLIHAAHGRALSMLQANDAAMQAIDLALQNARDHLTVLRWGAEVRQRAGDVDGARVLLKRLLALQPGEPSVQATLVALGADGE